MAGMRYIVLSGQPWNLTLALWEYMRQISYSGTEEIALSIILRCSICNTLYTRIYFILLWLYHYSCKFIHTYTWCFGVMYINRPKCNGNSNSLHIFLKCSSSGFFFVLWIRWRCVDSPIYEIYHLQVSQNSTHESQPWSVLYCWSYLLQRYLQEPFKGTRRFFTKNSHCQTI